MNIKIPLHSSLFVAVGSSAVLLAELAYAAERDLTKHNHELAKRDHARGALKKQAHAQGLRALLNKDEANGVSMSMPMSTEAVAEWGSHDEWTDSGLKILLAYLNAHGKDIPGACHPYCPTPPPTPPTCDEECKKKCDLLGRVDCTCALTVCDPLNLTIENPSFETNPNPDPNWTVASGGAEWLDAATYWNAYDGSYSIDMNSGSISQELLTTEGCTYKIEFAMSNNPAADYCNNALMPMIQVSATPSAGGAADSSEDYTSSTPVTQVSDFNSPAVAVYEIKDFEFVATSSSTILKFDSITDNTSCAGPILDDIQVVVL